MSKPCYSEIEGDRFSEDPEDIVNEFLECCDDDIEFPYELEIAEADSMQFPLSRYIDPDSVIECAQESAFERVDECADGWLCDLPKAQRADLLANLDRWAGRWGLHPKFWEVKNVRRIKILILDWDGNYKFKEDEQLRPPFSPTTT